MSAEDKMRACPNAFCSGIEPCGACTLVMKRVAILAFGAMRGPVSSTGEGATRAQIESFLDARDRAMAALVTVAKSVLEEENARIAKEVESLLTSEDVSGPGSREKTESSTTVLTSETADGITPIDSDVRPEHAAAVEATKSEPVITGSLGTLEGEGGTDEALIISESQQLGVLAAETASKKSRKAVIPSLRPNGNAS